jgi:hypothetical protein
MIDPREGGGAAELPDSRILMVGGQGNASTGWQSVTATAEVYLPCPPNLAPVAACKPDYSVYTSASPATCSVTVGDVDNGSYDPDNQPGPFSVSQAPLAGTVYNGPGTRTVTLTANDGELSRSCTTKVTLVDNTLPQVTCTDDDPNVPGNQDYLECVNGGASGTFTAQATDNCGGSTTATCSPSSAVLPVGSITPVTCTSRDASQNQGSCNLQAIVRDTRPPVPAAIPSKGMVLSPASGALVEVSLMDCANFVVDACSGRLNPLKDHAVITKITSDEDEDLSGGNDGNTLGDMQIKKPWLALVRAERNSTLDGRVYTLHYQAKDADGNLATGSCKVGVPKNQNSTAVAGAPVYCVGPGC